MDQGIRDATGLTKLSIIINYTLKFENLFSHRPHITPCCNEIFHEITKIHEFACFHGILLRHGCPNPQLILIYIASLLIHDIEVQCWWEGSYLVWFDVLIFNKKNSWNWFHEIFSIFFLISIGWFIFLKLFCVCVNNLIIILLESFLRK